VVLALFFKPSLYAPPAETLLSELPAGKSQNFDFRVYLVFTFAAEDVFVDLRRRHMGARPKNADPLVVRRADEADDDRLRGAAQLDGRLASLQTFWFASSPSVYLCVTEFCVFQMKVWGCRRTRFIVRTDTDRKTTTLRTGASTSASTNTPSSTASSTDTKESR